MAVKLSDVNKAQYLLMRRYPAAGAWISLPSLNSARPAPDRGEIEAVKAYRAELNALSEEDLAARYEAEYAKDLSERLLKAEQEERDRFFNQPWSNADFGHWSKAAHWTLDEAIALSLGKAPESVNWQKIGSFVGVSPFVREYTRRRDLALRAVPWKQLFDPVLPGIFLAWCKRLDLSFLSRRSLRRVLRRAADWLLIGNRDTRS